MKPSNTDTQQVERDIQGQGMAAEQAADLARLTAQAAPTDADAAGWPGAPEPEPQGPDLAQEIAGMVTVAVATLGPMFPSLKETYTPEITQAAAQAIAQVCQKHGWMQNGLMGKWGEEIACLAVVGPLAFQTYQGIRADLAARAPAKPAESLEGPSFAAEAPKAPAQSKNVTFGAPVSVDFDERLATQQ